MLVPSSAVLSVDIQLVSVDFHEIQFFGAHKIFFVYVGTVHILIDFMIYFWLVNIKKMTGYIYRTFTISRFEHSKKILLKTISYMLENSSYIYTDGNNTKTRVIFNV